MKFLLIIISLLLPPQFIFAFRFVTEFNLASVCHISCISKAYTFVNLNALVQEHNVLFKQLSTLRDIFSCHILFLSRSAQSQFAIIFATLKNKPILTIGNTEHFVIEGGMVQFYRHEGKIRLMIDPQTLAESGLKPSSHLMGIVQSVKK